MLCFSLLGIAVAQNVSNIRVQQHDTLLVVTYNLAAKANIEAFISFDGGTTYRGPLKYVTGAVGKGVLPEKDKIFVWDVIKEVGYIDASNAVIKIVSTGEKPPKEDDPEKPRAVYIPKALGIEGTFGGWGKTAYYDLGVRLTRNLSPHFGVDIVKVKYAYGYRESPWDLGDAHEYWWDTRSIQFLIGARIASPYFDFGKKKKTMHGYSSLRIGGGWSDYFEHSCYGSGDSYHANNYTDKRLAFAIEWDVMLHTGRFFVGYSLNVIRLEAFHGLRLGADFGQKKEKKGRGFWDTEN